MLSNLGTVFKDIVEIDQDFVQGDKNTIEKLIVNIYGKQAAPRYSDEQLQEQLKEYRRYIIETYKYLDFKGIDGIAEAVKGSSGVTLESVYVPLRARMDTPDGESWHRLGGRYYCGSKAVSDKGLEFLEKEMGRAEAAALPVEQWVNDQQALIILGDPGSGKSTSMKRLALGLAQRDNAPLPILLPLNAYSKVLEKQTISFEDYLSQYFNSKRSQLEQTKLQQLFMQALEQEKAIILMDGLDEVGDNRGEVVAQVESFVRAWIPDPSSNKASGNRMVVTSRFVGYQDYPLTDPRWKTVALNDWNAEEIERFFASFTLASELAWSGGENNENSQTLAEQEKKSLLRVIKNNQGIRRLSGNPLLASLLALIKRQGVTLPHRRVELYNLYMGTLLRSWNRSRGLDKQPIGPEIDFSPTQKLLAKLALHLRQTNPQGGLISEDAMHDYLRDYYENDGYTRKEADEQSKDFLMSVHKYSNLLIEKGHRQYGFIHLTFEEYLAGFGLALEREKVLSKRIPEYLQQPKQWKETLLLSLGVMSVVNTATDKANDVLEELLDKGDVHYVLFTGEVLNDVGKSVLGNKMTRKIQKALLEIGQNSALDIGYRRKAGLFLGDSAWLPDDLDRLLPIKKGEFFVGNDKEIAEIKQDYWIGKYLVTNAQYKQFIDDNGYQNSEYWTDKAWSLKEEKNWQQPNYWEEYELANPLFPVVGVSWYEANAYCCWLQTQIQENPERYGLSSKRSSVICRLPSNDEWECAARGRESNKYPWGDDFDAKKVNGGDSWKKSDNDSGGTTAVNLFKEGVSPDGLYDCSGNVWEWNSSLDTNGAPYIRGGSFYVTSNNLRCAVRDWYTPNYRYGDLGFRVCCVS